MTDAYMIQGVEAKMPRDTEAAYMAIEAVLYDCEDVPIRLADGSREEAWRIVVDNDLETFVEWARGY